MIAWLFKLKLLNITNLPKILILIPIWKRPQITEICLRGLQRVNEHRPVQVLAVISEKSYIPACKRYNISYTFFDNFPLGRKKNHGLKVALEMEWDYLMELNSDDVIKNELIDRYDQMRHDYLGLRNFVFINSKNMDCRQIQNKTMYGIGRRYSRRLVELVSGEERELWNNEANIGMDNYCDWKIWKKTGMDGKQLFTPEPLAADIKSDVNLWPFPEDVGVKYPIKDFLKDLSQDEIDMIHGLSN